MFISLCWVAAAVQQTPNLAPARAQLCAWGADLSRGMVPVQARRQESPLPQDTARQAPLAQQRSQHQEPDGRCPSGNCLHVQQKVPSPVRCAPFWRRRHSTRCWDGIWSHSLKGRITNISMPRESDAACRNRGECHMCAGKQAGANAPAPSGSTQQSSPAQPAERLFRADPTLMITPSSPSSTAQAGQDHVPNFGEHILS